MQSINQRRNERGGGRRDSPWYISYTEIKRTFIHFITYVYIRLFVKRFQAPSQGRLRRSCEEAKDFLNREGGG